MAPADASEVDALLAIRDATFTGCDWAMKAGYGWLDLHMHRDPQICMGITVEDGHVVEINLHAHMCTMRGVLPPVFRSFTLLRDLRIYDHQEALTGPIPPLSAFSKLEWCLLHRNGFTGTLPCSFPES